MIGFRTAPGIGIILPLIIFGESILVLEFLSFIIYFLGSVEGLFTGGGGNVLPFSSVKGPLG